jgi:uncharacterized membrane protein YeaQ/YmgE (transglycosylase-associated protein family)
VSSGVTYQASDNMFDGALSVLDSQESTMVGALILGFVAGVIARVLMPGDVFRKMGGPKSWGVSILLGLAGALLGWVIFTLGLGIGDDDIFDWGGIVGAIIGTLIVMAIANWYFRSQAREEAAAVAAPPPSEAMPPAEPPVTTPPPPAAPTPPPASPDVPPERVDPAPSAMSVEVGASP